MAIGAVGTLIFRMGRVFDAKRRVSIRSEHALVAVNGFSSKWRQYEWVIDGQRDIKQYTNKPVAARLNGPGGRHLK
jgi:hypothetical protein